MVDRPTAKFAAVKFSKMGGWEKYFAY